MSGDDPDDDEDFPAKISAKTGMPVKAQSQLDKARTARARIDYSGPSKTHMPDFNKMLSHKSKSMSDPFDQDFSNSYVRNPLGENKTSVTRDIQAQVQKMFKSPKFAAYKPAQSSEGAQVLAESFEEEETADLNEHRELLIIDDDDDDGSEDK